MGSKQTSFGCAVVSAEEREKTGESFLSTRNLNSTLKLTLKALFQTFEFFRNIWNLKLNADSPLFRGLNILLHSSAVYPGWL